MEDMDIDDIIYVPDTPDRVVSRRAIARGPWGLGGNLAATRNFRSIETLNESHVNGHTPNNRLSRKPPVSHPPKPFRAPRPANSIDINSNSETSSTPQIPWFPREVPADTSSSHRARSNGGPGIADKGKSVGTEGIRSLAKLNVWAENPNTVFRNGVSKEKGKGQVEMDGCSKSWENLRKASMESVKIDEHTPRAFSPKRSGRKCLVKNGCISPDNVAKTEQLKNRSGNIEPSFSTNGVSDLAQPSRGSDRNRIKGKAVFTIPDSPKKHNEMNFIGTSSSASTTHRDANGEGGWRTTHNYSGNLSSTVPDESRRFPRRIGGERNSQRHESRSERRENGENHKIEHDHAEIDASVRAVSSISETGQSSDRFRSDKMVTKRLKKHGSTSKSEDPDMLREFVKSSPSRVHRPRSSDSSFRIIDVDEFSPPVRRSWVNSNSMSESDESEARKHQVEADEILARELQEQFYHEMPVHESDERGSSIENILRHEMSRINGSPPSGTEEEIDEQLAWILQQDDDDDDDVPLARGSVHSNRQRLPRSHPTQSRPSMSSNRSFSPQRQTNRRVTRARASNSLRMAQLRGGRIRQRPGVSNEARSLQFPPDMDINMRVNIRETLETMLFRNFSNNQRDFNEDDYEMLLALDDQNHRHGGASSNQINLLPQSVVQQADNQEVCAVCLETPTIGETVRHLPCFHKFHKDCIDQWLKRKTSCPICKCSVT